MDTFLFADNLTETIDVRGLSGSVALCAAILFVSFWLMFRGRFAKKQKTDRHSTNGPVMPSETEEKATAHIAETYETVRELIGRVDTKLRLLNALIRDADRAAARLEAARRGEAPVVRAERSAESCIDDIRLYADYGFSVSDIAARLEVPVESVARILATK